ncbi:MAG: DEAD/DEAH box helicase [Cryobacterium sp.]|nr:DEAD/DEAH box helicase [Cryobacterium sp.]
MRPASKQKSTVRTQQRVSSKSQSRTTRDAWKSNEPTSSKPGSRSPKHRGYRAVETDTPKQKRRWNSEDRKQRAGSETSNRGSLHGSTDSSARKVDRRKDWQPENPRSRKVERESKFYPKSERIVRETSVGQARTQPERQLRERGERQGSARFDRGNHERFDRSDRLGRADRSDRAGRPDRSTRQFGGKAIEHEQRDDVVLERLEAKAVQATDTHGMGFADLGLGQNIVRELRAQGAENPFPIQAATIPDVLKGLDVLGRGRTGSGKTIAFGAPLVERLLLNWGAKDRKQGRPPRALILAPTRELALQIDRTIQPIARSVGLFTTQIYGGVPQARQVTALQRGVDIVIGTPGRIEDLVEQRKLDLSEVSITVIDEADHMCELGFLEPVQRILRLTASGGQKLLYSATLDAEVANLVEEFLVNPSVYEVAGEDQSTSTIEHRVLMIDQREKREIIRQLASGSGRTLIFARTRAFAEEIADELDDFGIRAVSLHGDLNQAKRTRNLEKLTSGRVNVLVATDVAARGIHVDDISLVIQADPPDEYKTYLHRSGRTGRAGRSGTVVTLVNSRRHRRFDELLKRAEITPTISNATVGDSILDELAAC